jgi:hypothetical protein
MNDLFNEFDQASGTRSVGSADRTFDCENASAIAVLDALVTTPKLSGQARRVKRSQGGRPTRWWPSVLSMLIAFLAAGFALLQPAPETYSVAVPRYVTKNIEDIQKGDTVLAFNPQTGNVERRRVVEAYKRVSDHLRILTFAAADRTNQTQETTEEHPYWLPDRSEFVEAKDLKEGDRVTGPNGEIQTLLSSRYEPHPEGIPVFNFQVEGVHTYFVLAPRVERSPILVHNAGCGHEAHFEHRNSRGRLITRGTVQSGGTHPGRRLSYEEQRALHTERKVMDGLDEMSVVHRGHELEISGTKPPCQFCQDSMDLWAQENGATIRYYWDEFFMEFEP